MANKKTSNPDNFADLVARLNQLSNYSPESERVAMMEAASQEPQVLDRKDVSLADIAKLAGIKEYEESISKDAENLVDRITKTDHEGDAVKSESVITQAIKESDADESIATKIRKDVTEESKRLDKIAQLETQLAELKMAEKDEATLDLEGFKSKFIEDITAFVKESEGSDLVELYNNFSQNQVDVNEDTFIVSTPETKEIIADAEKTDETPEEVIAEKEPSVEAPVEEEDMGEDVELEVATEQEPKEPKEVPYKDKLSD